MQFFTANQYTRSSVSWCKYLRKENIHNMEKRHTNEENSIKFTAILAITVIAIVAIVALSICYLSSNGFNTQLSVDKEKIEVTTENSNSNFSNTNE